jgi:Glutathione peroxidase
LFNYLKDALPGFITNKIKWNFSKFVIDRHGKPVKRFAPITSPLKMETLIVSLLKDE